MLSSLVLGFSLSAFGCTLITDVDRSKIPDPAPSNLGGSGGPDGGSSSSSATSSASESVTTSAPTPEAGTAVDAGDAQVSDVDGATPADASATVGDADLVATPDGALPDNDASDTAPDSSTVAETPDAGTDASTPTQSADAGDASVLDGALD